MHDHGPPVSPPPLPLGFHGGRHRGAGSPLPPPPHLEWWDRREEAAAGVCQNQAGAISGGGAGRVTPVATPRNPEKVRGDGGGGTVPVGCTPRDRPSRNAKRSTAAMATACGVSVPMRRPPAGRGRHGDLTWGTPARGRGEARGRDGKTTKISRDGGRQPVAREPIGSVAALQAAPIVGRPPAHRVAAEPPHCADRPIARRAKVRSSHLRAHFRGKGCCVGTIFGVAVIAASSALAVDGPRDAVVAAHVTSQPRGRCSRARAPVQSAPMMTGQAPIAHQVSI